MYNKITMKEKEDLYLRKRSKFYSRGTIEPMDWLNSEMSLNLNNDDIFRSDAGKRHSSAWVVGLRCIFMVEMQIF